MAKRQKVPRTRANNKWTEAAFWGFLRSGLRQLSRRWPPLVEYPRTRRRPYDGPNKRQKWEYHCECCGEWFKGTEVQVDHITPCGSLKSLDDLRGFVARLFCEADGLQLLCTDCHQAKPSSSS